MQVAITMQKVYNELQYLILTPFRFIRANSLNFEYLETKKVCAIVGDKAKDKEKFSHFFSYNCFSTN